MERRLRGRDHTELGAVAIEAVGPNAAIGLTRGRFKKAYRYLDPNEDTVAIAVGDRATLLVVADAHNGHVSADVAVDHVLAALGEDPPPADLDDHALVELVFEANEAVLRATASVGLRSESRTTLTIGLVSAADGAGARVLQFASMGDSALLVGVPGEGSEVTRPHHTFVGYPMSPLEVAGRTDRHRVALDAGAWVVAVSDGFTNFVGPARTGEVLGEVLRATEDPEAVVRALIDRAGDEGAGDNVAVAALAPPTASERPR